MTKATRRSFTREQKEKYVADYTAAVAERKGQQWIDTNGITASNIAAFKQSLSGKKAVSIVDRSHDVGGKLVVSQATVRSSQTPNIERLRVGLELAVAELGGSIQWYK